jgi:non-homologous end joining protein Ku
MPPLRTGLLSFGLVSIPIQLYTATKDQRIAFNLLHAKCGSRIQNRYYCPVCNVVVERDGRVRGSPRTSTSSLPMLNWRAWKPNLATTSS